MNTSLLAIVKWIVEKNGEGILNDPVKLKPIFANFIKNEPKDDRTAFGRCIEIGCYRELKKARTNTERGQIKASLAVKLKNISGLNTTLCRDTLDLLEAALFGNITPTQWITPQAQITSSIQTNTKRKDSSRAGLMVIIIIVILFLGILIKLMETNSTHTSKQESITVTKEYRPVNHITNELSPILKIIAEELEYNDVGGIENWIFAEDISNSQLGAEIRRMRNTKTANDQNSDGVINCQDFAILFYKMATEAGYDVKIMSNKKLNHVFNAIRRADGTYETIEPQAGRGGKIIMKKAWNNYNPSFDKDDTEAYQSFLK